MLIRCKFLTMTLEDMKRQKEHLQARKQYICSQYGTLSLAMARVF